MLPPARAPRRLAVAVVLPLTAALALASCGSGSGSGGEAGGGGTSPSTSRPPAPTTTVLPSTTTTTLLGDGAGVLDGAGAEAQLRALLPIYTRAIADAVAAGDLGEGFLRQLHRSLTPQRAGNEQRALQEAGLGALRPRAPVPTVAEVAVVEAREGCASGSAVVTGVTDLAAVPQEVAQPFYFRLRSAGEGAEPPGWRIDFLNWSGNGVPLTAESACA